MIRLMDLTALIHVENGSYWAEVEDLPGCFASGDTLDELFEGLREGISLCLDDDRTGPLRLSSVTLTDSPLTVT